MASICVTEVLANVIAHGGAGTGSSPITLRLDCAVRAAATSITVSDAGTAFDLLMVAPKAAAHACTGGAGRPWALCCVNCVPRLLLQRRSEPPDDPRALESG